MRSLFCSPLVAAFALSCAFPASIPAAQESQAERDERMEWFRDSRFGMFIHWGLYAVPAGEYRGNTNYGEWFLEETKMPVSQYEKYAAQFSPVKFDARAWARMAKNAGMKYMVITSKHHDGFAMWRSDLTDWCIKSTPFQRDPLKELAAACKKEGIRFCLYHSIMDWHHPDWGTRRAWNDKASGTPDMDRYTAYMKGQLKELLTGYGPLGILWFDGEWENPWTPERGVDLYNYVRGLQPKVIVNNRVGKGRGGMGGMDSGSGAVGDYGTPEQEIPPTGFGPGVDWESCMTMNNHWGYNKADYNWKSTTTLVRNLIDCASKGGNYLLNIGPTAEGLFPETSVARLAEIGKWMKANGEAIYETQASPFKRLPWGRCTQQAGKKETTLYLHVFNWPPDGKLFVPGLKNEAAKAYLLSSPKRALQTVAGSQGLQINVPDTAPDPISSTVVLRIRGPLEIEQVPFTQDPSGAVLFLSAEARLHGSQIKYEQGDRRDNIGFWLNPEEWVDWEFTVNKPGKYRLLLDAASPAPSAFEIEVAGHKLHAAVPSTGDYGEFKVTDVGVVELTKSGKTTLSVRPVKNGWNAVNLKSVALKPAP